jgi:hypothetical protein
VRRRLVLGPVGRGSRLPFRGLFFAPLLGFVFISDRSNCLGGLGAGDAEIENVLKTLRTLGSGALAIARLAGQLLGLGGLQCGCVNSPANGAHTEHIGAMRARHEITAIRR